VPTYVFTSKDDSVSFEKYYPIGHRPEKVKSGGKWCYYDVARTHSPVRAMHGALWPRFSDAAGVNPSQVKEAMAADKKLGVPASYDSEGRVKFESHSHEKKWCEAHGMYQRNSYGTGRDADRERANANAKMNDQNERARELIDAN